MDSIAQPESATIASPLASRSSPTPSQPEQAADLPAPAGLFWPCLTEPVVHLPDGATPTSAHVCSTEVAAVPGDGEWLFTVTRRVTAGLPALLEAYRTSDEDRTDGPCRDDLPDPRVVWLEIGASTVPVRAPYDGCAKPIPSAVQAYDALVTVVENRQPVRQVSSQLAVDSGCSPEWKDMLAIEADLNRSVPTTAPTPLAGAVRVCTYDVVEAGVGRLSDGRALSADDLRSINVALAQARPDDACRRDGHQRFALLLPEAGEPTYVALDGCAVEQGEAWWRAGGGLRGALAD